MVRNGITLALVAFALVAAGCGDGSGSVSAAPASEPSQTESTLVFPVQGPRKVVMAAEWEGILTRDGDCLRLGDTPDAATPVWPLGFTYEEHEGEVTVSDETGAEAVRAGEHLRMGGGLMGEDGWPIPKELRKRVKHCPAPYWIVGEVESTRDSSPSVTKTESGRFEGLTITLELKASSVASGRQIRSTLTVRNNSGKTIVDPSCLIASGAYALVPVDDPDAELWLQPIVDCQGPNEMPDGYIDRSDGPTFFARTKHGDPLPPGDYIAALEIEGYPEHIEKPVEVTE